MKTALAVLFQQGGKEIDKEDFIYIQSADLDWYSSDEARKLLDKAVASGLVTIESDSVKAEFDFGDIDIPIGFEPTKDILKEKGEIDLFPQILNEVVDHSGFSRQEIMSLVNKKQDELDLEIKTALLLVAHEKDIDISDRDDYIEKVAENIKGS